MDLARRLFTLLRRDDVLLLLGAVSISVMLLSMVLVPLFIIRMRPDYFVRQEATPDSFRRRHPALRFLGVAGKNLLGGFLVLAGLTLFLLPGQGLLTMFVGLTLVDFPGKRRVETWVIARPAVLRAVRWIRRRAGRLPLEVPAVSGS